jgi:hypothetical protein
MFPSMAINPFTGEFEHSELKVKASLVRAHDGCPDVNLHFGEGCVLSVNQIAHLSGPENRAKLAKWVLEANGFSAVPEVKPPETPSRFERDEVI